MFPANEKTRSDAALLAGIDSKFIAILDNLGYFAPLFFYHIITSKFSVILTISFAYRSISSLALSEAVSCVFLTRVGKKKVAFLKDGCKTQADKSLCWNDGDTGWQSCCVTAGWKFSERSNEFSLLLSVNSF